MPTPTPIPSESESTSTRSVPMEVLCLGMCRTGTQSLAEALTILGYDPIYHMREVRKHGHEEHWINALTAKYEGSGRNFGREEFDAFLGGWAGVTDIPAALLSTELMQAYPAAKIILTVRDVSEWHASMRSTIWSIPPTRPLGRLLLQHVWGGDPEGTGEGVFVRHNESVLHTAGGLGREVLVWEVGEGWGRLCEFLGREVPVGAEGVERGFPRSDDWAAFGWKVGPLRGASRVGDRAGD